MMVQEAQGRAPDLRHDRGRHRQPAICHALNADETATAWSHQTIIELVRNERYVGKLLWN
ncbi:MAG: recombinase family protein [Deltaproteobacteria bacterium]|nr:recombinase family protein [Deltaproteobacteria bacterium]